MSVLTTIRDRFATKVREEREADTTSYRELVQKIADGEEPDFETVDRLLSKTGRIPTPVCPRSANHTDIKVRRTSGTIKFCLCNDCGTEWQHEFDPDQPSPEPGRKTLEDLEEDVTLLKQRRVWKEQLDRVPEIDRQRSDLTRKLEAAEERVRKAQETRRELSEQLQPELSRLDADRNQANRARESLVKTCMGEASFKEVAERRKTMVARIQHLKNDLWGYGRPGTFDNIVRGTIGDEILSYKRRIARLTVEVGHTNRQSKHDELATNKRKYTAFWDLYVKPKIDEYERLTAELPDVEQELAELQKQKLNP